MDRAPQLPYALLDDPYIDPLIRRQNLRALTRPTTMAVSSETDRRLREILQGSGGLNPAVRQPRRAPTAIEAQADPNAMVQPAPVPMNFGDNRVTDAVLDEFAPAQPDGPATTRPTPRGNPRAGGSSERDWTDTPLWRKLLEGVRGVNRAFDEPRTTRNAPVPAGVYPPHLRPRDAANAEFAYEAPTTTPEPPPGAGIGLPPGAMLYRDTANDPLAQAIAAAQAGSRPPAESEAAQPPADTGASQPAQGDTPPPPALTAQGAPTQNPAVSDVSGVTAPPPPAPAPRPEAAAQAAAQAVAESGGTPEQQQDAALSAYERASQAARERVQAILAQQEGAGISDRDKWLSLALGGARMAASRNPTFFGALGEGAEAGIQNFAAQDRLAKEQARARTSQQLQAEQLAETAGDRAERRVNQAEDIRFRHLDRRDRNEARAKDLEFRYKELKQRSEDNRLSREERAEAAREATAARLEIAKLYDQSRRYTADQNLAGRKYTADQNLERSRMAGATGTRETKWIDYAIDNGLVEDTVDGRKAALAMIRPDSQRGMDQTRAQITDRIYRTLMADLTDRRPEAEKRAAAMAAASEFVRDNAATAAPRPAAAAPPAAPAAPAQGAPAAGNIARPATPAEAAALPPGTRYITPDGRQLVR